MKNISSTNRKSFLLLFLITLLGAVLRIYHLDQNPPALNWDWVSLGYNAYSILTTGKDEYGTPYPFMLRSYDVYFLPLAVYTLIPSIALFGLTEVGVRATAVFLGILMIPITYIFVQKLTAHRTLALLSTFFLALSPWHVQYSREAHSHILYPLLALSGTLVFLFSLKRPWMLPIALGLFILSFYLYHAAVVGSSLLLFALIIIYFRNIPWSRWIIVAGIVSLLAAAPLFYAVQFGSAADRFAGIGITQRPDIFLPQPIKRIDYDFQQGDSLSTILHNRRIVYARNIAKSYFDHWRFDYLFFDGMMNRLFRIPDIGLLYYWDLPFLLLGLYYILRSLRKKTSKVILAWFLIAPIPASLALGAPASLRVTLFMPILQILIATGFLCTWNALAHIRFGRIIRFSLVMLFLINVYFFFHMLFVHTPIETAESWNYSVKQAVQEVRRIEDSYNEVIFTYRYKQPYMYYLFYNKIDPAWFQEHWYPGEVFRRARVVDNITYRNLRWDEDSQKKNALLVGAPEEFPENVNGIIRSIQSLNGEVTLLFVDTNLLHEKKDEREQQEEKLHTEKST